MLLLVLDHKIALSTMGRMRFAVRYAFIHVARDASVRRVRTRQVREYIVHRHHKGPDGPQSKICTHHLLASTRAAAVAVCAVSIRVVSATL